MSVPSIRPKIEPLKRDRRNGASWRKLHDALRHPGSHRETLSHEEARHLRSKLERHRAERELRDRARALLVAALAVVVGFLLVAVLVLLW